MSEGIQKYNGKNGRLSEHVVYVGMMNPGLRTFDIIMHTKYGTSYNSYLIMGEKNVLVETVHDVYTKEYIERIEEYVPISEIDYIIMNHTEPDHSGSLCELININPEITVIGSPAAIKNLQNITNITFKSQTVKQGDTLDLGNGEQLEFIIAPNLHWPDSMFTYYRKEKILFSCDFFGTHYCEQFVFDYQLKRPEKYESERKNYFDCIFSPFKKFVLDGIAKMEQLDISLICCSHGPVLSERIKETVELYREWATVEKKELFVPIFYVSAYGYTRTIANEIASFLKDKSIKAKVFDLVEYSVEEAASIMNDAPAVMFGSPTINGDALEPIWNLIDKSVIPIAKGKPALVFGSYGWSGEACGCLSERLKMLKYNVFPTMLKVQFKPSEVDLANVRATMEEFVKEIV